MTLAPEVRARFTRFSVLATDASHFRDDWGYLVVRATDCEIWGGATAGYVISCYFTNCFLDRVYGGQVAGLPGNEIQLRNCTWRGGLFQLTRWYSPIPVSLRDTAFDGTAFDVNDDYAQDPAYTDYDYNAFLTGSPRTTPTGAHDVLVGNFGWLPGALGRYYLPVGSTLINAGSQTAAASGLYHFTTTTDQAKEAATTVDIGLHWLALDGEGKPVDSDKDSLADYLEDRDGNGAYGGGDLANWSKVDTDGDALSDWAELNVYGSDPKDPKSLRPGPLGQFPDDGEYLFAAKGFFPASAPCTCLTMAHLHISDLGNGMKGFQILMAPPGTPYDLYFVNSIAAQRWQWRRVFCGVQCDANGSATFKLRDPDPVQGYFVILCAEDTDGDGLSDGYECWFTYNGQKTVMDDPETDDDQMRDGWEVAYGLNPTSSGGVNDSANGNPDADGFSNVQEYGFQQVPNDPNNQFVAPSYDPLKFNTAQQAQNARPVVSIFTTSLNAISPGGSATFTIRRTIGQGASLSPLTVYFSVGGTAEYPTDYSLSESQGYPRILSATIAAGEADKTVTVSPGASGVKQAGAQTINVQLTPYGVTPATLPSADTPPSWSYVVDVHHQAVTLNIHNGILINLEKTTPDGYLRIKPVADTKPLPFINVANSSRGTVARIYTGADPASDPSGVVGEYLSAPDNRGRNPSRTTVDRYGNIWVGNRAEGYDVSDGNGGSITEFGIVIGGTRCRANRSSDPDGDFLKEPFIYNTCVDRHGATVNDPPDGLIRTARAASLQMPSNLQLPWSNSDSADSLGGVSTAEDEAILSYLRVVPIGVRTIVIDPSNNLWVGSHLSRWNEFIDTGAGMQVTGRRLSWPGGGYGGVIGGDGAIWSSGAASSPPQLLRFQPGAGMPVTSGGTIRNTEGNYGIGVDPLTGAVWQPRYTTPGEVMQFRVDHCSTRFPIGQALNRGIVIDGHGNVWVGGSDSTIFHLTTAGATVGAVSISPGSEPLGVTVDSSGMIWAICANNYAVRIDPSLPAVTFGNDRPVGQVVEVVPLGAGAGPYNYSDMSGFVTLSTAQSAGVWDYVEDSGTPETQWTSLNRDAQTPVGTRIVVEVRAANTITELPSWPFRPVVVSGVTPQGTTPLPAGTKGQYIEVRVNLLRDFGVAGSPELRSLTLQHVGAGCAISIATHPKSQAVLPGGSASFTVVAQVPQSASAGYQWFKNGAAITGVLTVPLLNINNASYTDAGRYTVKVTASGCTSELESAPARLHIKGNPPTIIQDFPSDPASNPLIVPSGQTVSLMAQAFVETDPTPNPGEYPISYQWRFNNEPMAGSGTSGGCGSGNCTASLPAFSALCSKAGFYSVVFWNQYGQVATRNYELKIENTDYVTVTPLGPIPVTSANQTVTLTAVECLGGVSCRQWYLTTPDGKKVAIPGATGPSYTIPKPITCDRIGDYTVSVADGGWNSYEASATVTATPPPATIDSATLEFTRDGTGPWTYKWYRRNSFGSYVQVASSAGYSPSEAGYYKVTATRTGTPSVEVLVTYDHETKNIFTSTIAGGKLKVTYTANPNCLGPFRWAKVPHFGGNEETKGTGIAYTVILDDCSPSGTYKLYVSESCNPGAGSPTSFFLDVACF